MVSWFAQHSGDARTVGDCLFSGCLGMLLGAGLTWLLAGERK